MGQTQTGLGKQECRRREISSATRAEQHCAWVFPSALPEPTCFVLDPALHPGDWLCGLDQWLSCPQASG